MRSTTRRTVGKAKGLRGSMSLPEVLLWQRLRSVPVKFRRQHPIGQYVVDFYCPSAKLIVEVDGAAHDCGDRPVRDAARTVELETRGFRMIRVPARDVLADPDAVADSLLRMCL